MDIATHYRTLRKREPWMRAHTALAIAKGQAKPTTLAWETFTRNHVGVGRGTVDGFDVTVKVDDDEGRQYEYSFTDKDTGIRNPQYRWDGPGSEAKFIDLESGETVPELAEWYHKDGMSKSVALDFAREALNDEAKSYFANDVMLLVITATAYVEGVEVGSASYGTELSMRDSYVDLKHDLDDASTDAISEAIADARENLTKVLASEQAKVAALEKMAAARG